MAVPVVPGLLDFGHFKPLLFKGGVGVVRCRQSLRERCSHIATTPTPPLKRRG